MMLFAFGLALLAAVENPPETPLETAARTYDLDAARHIAVSEELPGGPLECARAQLLVADLLRLDYEFTPENDLARRRALGKEIDIAADAGLLTVESLPESSEKYRIQADLIGTKMRSDYRAAKLRHILADAIDEALRLDPQNARALVSKANTYIFRPVPSTEDLSRAKSLLDSALSIDTALEQAHLLEAHIHELQGDRDGAIAAYRDCLQRNPDCTPAKRALNHLQSEMDAAVAVTPPEER